MSVNRFALVRALGTIVTPEGDFLLVQSGGEELQGLRDALSDGFAGIALCGCRGLADVQRLAVLLSVAEAEAERPDGSTRIIALTDGIFSSPTIFMDAPPRLAGLAWDARALSEVLGAPGRRTADGEWAGAFAAARAAVLLAAAAAGLPAYDAASPLAGEALAGDCRRSRADGFCGRLCDDAAQAGLIESVYGRSISKTSEASL